MAQLPVGTPDFDGARARIAEQGSVSPEQVASSLERLDDDERAFVRDAAREGRALQQSAGGEEGDLHFRERIAAGMANGSAFRPASSTHAAVVGAGSHQAVLDALDRPPAQPGERQYKGYTERELRRDWTQPLGGDDGEAGRRS